MDAFSKILDFIGKYAWAVLVTTCFILFVPDDVATQIGLIEFRSSFKGALWILLVLTSVVSVSGLYQYIDRKIFDVWLNEKRDKKKRQQQQSEFMESIVLRLSSLDLNERMWIKYCLFHNTQTLSAERSNRTAQSLNHKGIVEEGPGHILDLPFHMPDIIWQHLLEHKEEFLPEAERTDKRFPGALKNFRESLWANY